VNGDRFDVVIVGHGPVGQLAAALLARRGMHVCVVERHTETFGAPRAVHCDDEIVRIFQSLGIAEPFVRDTSTVMDYVWLSATGETLLNIPWRGHGECGWLKDNFFFQPRMERLLQSVSEQTGRVEVLRGWEVRQVERPAAAHVRAVVAVEVATGRERVLTGSYLLGADGANSVVRESLESRWTDLGFRAQWLVVDLQPVDPDARYPMLDSAQICDPARPTTLLRWIGRTHCRFEFMLVDGEEPEDFASDEAAWALVRPWGPTPENAHMVRHAVYEFRSVVADSWTDGRTFLIGDAAHLMPPFLGQGMCAGMRDAFNLSWKLDLVERGVAPARLLESYELERRAHVTSVVELSMALGRIASVVDPVAAAARDRAILAGTAPPPPPFPDLTEGIVARGEDGALGVGAGQVALQAVVRWGDRQGLLDDIVGGGWQVLSRRAEALDGLDSERLSFLATLDASLVHVTPAEKPGAVVDVEHRYAQWFGALGVDAVIVRPDFYIFGGARTGELPALLDELRRALDMPVRDAQLSTRTADADLPK